MFGDSMVCTCHICKPSFTCCRWKWLKYLTETLLAVLSSCKCSVLFHLLIVILSFDAVRWYIQFLALYANCQTSKNGTVWGVRKSFRLSRCPAFGQPRYRGRLYVFVPCIDSSTVRWSWVMQVPDCMSSKSKRYRFLRRQRLNWKSCHHPSEYESELFKPSMAAASRLAATDLAEIHACSAKHFFLADLALIWPGMVFT